MISAGGKPQHFKTLGDIQKEQIAIKPELVNYSNYRDLFVLSSIKSLFLDERNKEIVKRVIGILELHKKNLNNIELNSMLLMEGNFKEANFQNSNLQETWFYGANLVRANFKNSDLRGVSFERAVLHGAIFQGANMEPIKFMGISYYTTWYNGKVCEKGSIGFCVQNGHLLYPPKINPKLQNQLETGFSFFEDGNWKFRRAGSVKP